MLKKIFLPFQLESICPSVHPSIHYLSLRLYLIIVIITQSEYLLSSYNAALISQVLSYLFLAQLVRYLPLLFHYKHKKSEAQDSDVDLLKVSEQVAGEVVT